MPTLYNISDLIGKTLYAAKPIPLKRYTDDASATIYTVNYGNQVGQIYSYIIKGDGVMWWMFYDQNKKAYYAKHAEGNFSMNELQQQGLQTIVEKAAAAAKAEADKNKTWIDKILDSGTGVVKWGIGIFAVLYLGKELINSKKSN